MFRRTPRQRKDSLLVGLGFSLEKRKAANARIKELEADNEQYQHAIGNAEDIHATDAARIKKLEEALQAMVDWANTLMYSRLEKVGGVTPIVEAERALAGEEAEDQPKSLDCGLCAGAEHHPECPTQR